LDRRPRPLRRPDCDAVRDSCCDCCGVAVKFAFVTPRYGEEIVGGAEMAARMIAERLVSQLGWSVEIFTTRAKDIVTWANEYP
jgi:hypothetical protein